MATAVHQAAEETTKTLTKWTGEHSCIQVESIQSVPIHEASATFETEQETVCYCVMQVEGCLQGQLFFLFDDSSGFTLADIVLNQPVGTACDWGEMERSVCLETTNILGCSFLNSILSLSVSEQNIIRELIPTPPIFGKDFVESIAQFALIGQAQHGDEAFFVLTQFRIEQVPVQWTMLFLPAEKSLPLFKEALITEKHPRGKV